MKIKSIQKVTAELQVEMDDGTNVFVRAQFSDPKALKEAKVSELPLVGVRVFDKDENRYTPLQNPKEWKVLPTLLPKLVYKEEN